MSAPSAPSPSPPGPPSDDPFRYGWRFVRSPSGELEQVPLTLEDVLHPLEDDVIPERPIHQLERSYFADVARARPLGPPLRHVTSDCLVNWGVPGLRSHAPDVAIFVGLREEPDLSKGTFRLKKSGGRCLMVLEVVSPDTRTNDIDRKVEHYYRAGVPVYVLIDQETEGGPRSIIAYRRGRLRYEELQPDDAGGVALESINFRLSLRDNRLVCHDLETGKELGDYVRVAAALDEADRLIEEQKKEIEAATLRERKERRGRRRAERALKEAAAREESQRLASQASADRIRELEELLRRAHGGA